MLGHADIKQTQRYLNITDEELRKAVTEVWEGAVHCAPWASKTTSPRSHEQRQNPEDFCPLSRYRLSVICHSDLQKVARPAGLGTARGERSEWRRFPLDCRGRPTREASWRARQDSNLRPPA